MMTNPPLRSITRNVIAWGAAVMLAAPVATIAEEAAPPNRPLLWRVEGDKLEKPSYLFGTMHLSNERIRQLHPAADEAFTAADTVFTEIPLEIGAQMAAAVLMMRQDGKKLSESLGPETTAKLAERLNTIVEGFDVAPLEPLKTWVVAMQVIMMPLQLKGEPALDQIIWERAQAEGKETAALETIRDQIAAFETLNEEEQVLYLESTLEHYDEAMEMMAKLIAIYESGDEAAIYEMLTASMVVPGEDERLKEISERLLKALLEDRDVKMAAKIDEWLTANPAKSGFFAVGAAHYLGDNSIRKHLEEKGYRITTVVPAP